MGEYDDLVHRLRGRHDLLGWLTDAKAADAIESLTAERGAMRALLAEALDTIDSLDAALECTDLLGRIREALHG